MTASEPAEPPPARDPHRPARLLRAERDALLPILHRTPDRAWVRDPGTPYEVSRLKIMEYAQAIGDPNPVYRDLDAARQAGYPNVIAPPTFAVVVALPASIAAVRDTVPGTGYPLIVHVEQRFEYARPIRAGDVLHAESAVIGIRKLRGAAMVTTRTEIRAADGEQICSAWATLAKLPSAAKNDPPPPAPETP